MGKNYYSIVYKSLEEMNVGDIIVVDTFIRQHWRMEPFLRIRSFDVILGRVRKKLKDRIFIRRSGMIIRTDGDDSLIRYSIPQHLLSSARTDELLTMNYLNNNDLVRWDDYRWKETFAPNTWKLIHNIEEKTVLLFNRHTGKSIQTVEDYCTLVRLLFEC